MDNCAVLLASHVHASKVLRSFEQSGKGPDSKILLLSFPTVWTKNMKSFVQSLCGQRDIEVSLNEINTISNVASRGMKCNFSRKLHKTDEVDSNN